jgi:hypothetical protein
LQLALLYLWRMMKDKKMRIYIQGASFKVRGKREIGFLAAKLNRLYQLLAAIAFYQSRIPSLMFGERDC